MSEYLKNEITSWTEEEHHVKMNSACMSAYL